MRWLLINDLPKFTILYVSNSAQRATTGDDNEG